MSSCRRFTLSTLAAALFLAVAGTLPAPAADQPKTVVFAAASMKTALDAVIAKWSAATGKQATVSYASSGALAKQIEQAAPADIFISADLAWMDYLQERKLIQDASRDTLLGNALVLVAPTDKAKPFTLAKGADLAGAAGEGRIAVCTVTSCPAGKYAKEALGNLGMWATVEPKLAQADNVRAALALVAQSEVPFGIVYATDAKAEPKVKVVATFPEDSHKPVAYPVALTAASKNPDSASLLTYLRSPEAKAIFEGQGFTVLPKTP
jgi:molybdate transport system substrate-binding protein